MLISHTQNLTFVLYLGFHVVIGRPFIFVYTKIFIDSYSLCFVDYLRAKPINKVFF